MEGIVLGLMLLIVGDEDEWGLRRGSVFVVGSWGVVFPRCCAAWKSPTFSYLRISSFVVARQDLLFSGRVSVSTVNFCGMSASQFCKCRCMAYTYLGLIVQPVSVSTNQRSIFPR